MKIDSQGSSSVVLSVQAQGLALGSSSMSDHGGYLAAEGRLVFEGTAVPEGISREQWTTGWWLRWKGRDSMVA